MKGETFVGMIFSVLNVSENFTSVSVFLYFVLQFQITYLLPFDVSENITLGRGGKQKWKCEVTTMLLKCIQ